MRKRFAVALGAALLAGLTLTGSAQTVLPAVFSSDIVWHGEGREFGGFSGFELSADGQNFVAITDRGFVTEGRLQRKSGKLTGVSGAPLRRLDTSRRSGKLGNDSEGLAIDRNGNWAVSFEQRQTVQTGGPKGIGTQLPRHADFKRFPSNGGIEALAVDDAGRLYAIPERFHYQGDAPIYRYDGGAWQLFARLPRTDGFLPVGADFGPDGALYVLERAFSGIGFSSRVRRLSKGMDGLKITTLFRTGTGKHDNLEGLAVWQGSDGQIRLTMVADDNFRFFQRTEIVEYTVKSPLAKMIGSF